MNLQVIVAAAGQGSRWQLPLEDVANAKQVARIRGRPDHSRLVAAITNPDGSRIDKHEILVGGEPLLGRTVRVLNELGFGVPLVLAPTVHRSLVTSPCTWMDVNETASPSATLLAAEYDPEAVNMVLWGDVLHGAQTLTLFKTIVSFMQIGVSRSSAWVGRLLPNPYTGRRVPELYGYVVAPSESRLWMRALADYVRGVRPKHQPTVPPAWVEEMMFVCGEPMDKRVVMVEDWTDDVDTVREYYQTWPVMEPLALKEMPWHPTS